MRELGGNLEDPDPKARARVCLAFRVNRLHIVEKSVSAVLQQTLLKLCRQKQNFSLSAHQRQARWHPTNNWSPRSIGLFTPVASSALQTTSELVVTWRNCSLKLPLLPHVLDFSPFPKVGLAFLVGNYFVFILGQNLRIFFLVTTRSRIDQHSLQVTSTNCCN
jgi:hypothetical protein